MTLKDTFPLLYDIACGNDAFVAAHLDLTFFGRSNKRNGSFVRAVFFLISQKEFIKSAKGRNP
jgi:hypothetical protein